MTGIEILEGKVREGQTVRVDAKDGALEFSRKIVVKSVGFGLNLIFLVSAKSKTKFQFNGREYASAEEMPGSVGEAYDRAVGETPELHSGARLAAKLNAKIIVNDTEFSNPGEMSVDDRLLYHEALASVFPASIAVSISEAPKIKPKKVWLIVAIAGIAAGAVYLWLHGLFG